MPISFEVHVETSTTAPIEGAVVEAYDALGVTLSDTGVTDAGGDTTLTLEGSASGTVHHLKIYKTGTGLWGAAVEFLTRVSIRVYDPVPVSASNDALVVVDLMELTPATDTRFCRLVGRFLTLNNRPDTMTSLSIRARRLPAVMGRSGVSYLGEALVSESLTLMPDTQGRIQVELPRDGVFVASWNQGIYESCEGPYEFVVPDAASADLVGVLFLAPRSVVWSSNAVTVGVGQTVEVVPVSFVMSNSRTVDLDGEPYDPTAFLTPTVLSGVGNVEVRWSSSSALSIRGVLPGVSGVSVIPTSGLRPRWTPPCPFLQTPIAVTVV